ncbi:2-oxoacid:ferredoxin oxidoreductase subunit gamma [Candidatus Methanomassiliicoccus intestinalis]|uniref:Indolepyruvate ferredoxin oxidoreductase subunit beta n=1 Tax=Methanomassiliicoccus intestinalis (strain Issoire-Mx1) TaxID=1295009 RepID=R9T7F0_METII|nr:indolepyruvate ferredoxin oxidoreductase subunit beta [Candidatus Methanomassiliicoccus intestinalis]AGN26579.1 indolepyruvate oxidoreductase subunit beta [Candidatus Methanomassiliicoccus intestinalis Issoire-Mx1]TQS83613.1 MAG: 2-oxoacid:ferredoxin oxidoreductase subunit gamma [Candidatus Methanomassiliicoccus intestinalis]
MKYGIQLVGVGGQGVLLASTVLGSVAVSEGMDAAMSEVHGMAQRGGSVQCTVRIGQGVLSPLLAQGEANVLLGFEPAETCRNLVYASRDTYVITNTVPVVPVTVSSGLEEYPAVDDIIKAVKDSGVSRLIAIDAVSMAMEAGNAIAANSVLIGAMSAVPGFPLSKEKMLSILLERVPAKAKDVNQKAFEMGYEAALKCLSPQ